MTHGQLPTAARKINEEFTADSPDEIDDILNNDLPTHGGRVNLRPGSYTDTDWSQRIDIPDNDDSHFVIDMRGSDITLSTFSPTTAYILRPSSSDLSQRSIEFYGPKILDVTSVTDPPGFMQVDDIENSKIYIPGGRGAVDFVVKNVQTQGSGHMNKVEAQWRSADKGYIIEGSGQTNDRSFYYGQLQNLATTAVELINGANNSFWTQPEGGQGSATGYDFDSDANNNDIYITHNGPATPLDIEGDNNRVHYGLGEGASDWLGSSVPGLRPTNITAPGPWTVAELDLSFDVVSTGLIEGNGTGTPSVNNFRQMIVQAGGSDGNSTMARNTGALGNDGQGFLIYLDTKANTTTNAINRWGVTTDASGVANETEFVGLEADSADTNFRAVVHDGGGSGAGNRQVDADTGVTQDTSFHDFIIHYTQSAQHFFIDGSLVHTASQTTDFGNPAYTMADAENSGGTSAQINIRRWEWLAKA